MSEPQATKIVIAPVRVRELFTLRRLFARAVREHFAYFSPQVQKEIVANHSLLRLTRAAFNDRRVVLVARTPQKIIGYAIGAAPVTGPAQLFWLYVEPDYRGANTGLSLLSRALKQLSDTGAEVVSIATRDYRKYYERQGFKFVTRTIVHGTEMDILTFEFKNRTSQ
jgi:ribosomal protein S18 acetylase RimI-like enzyme